MEGRHHDINAIHSRDLDKLLVKIGMLDDFNAGRITCKFCKNIITRDNLYSILPESGAFNFVCEDSICVSRLLDHMDQKK